MENKNTQVIKSLSGDDNRLLEYIPYILQDLYSLGTDQELITELVKRNINLFSNVTSVLDLCCGKGAAIISLCQNFGWQGTGIDLFKPFIEDAKKNAINNGVSTKVFFEVMDIVDALNSYNNYDIIIYGSDVPSLGTEEEALIKIKKCLSSNGYILYETAYHSKSDLDSQIKSSGINILDKIIRQPASVKENNDFNTGSIEKRINELIHQFPEQKDIFQNYLKNQQDECRDLERDFTFAAYILC